jgi:hypothetical protein
VALPGDLTTITLTGTFTDGAGNAQSGSVLLTPSNPVTDQAGKTIIAQIPVTASLSSGSFSLPGLVCTNNVNLLPQGWWWVVQVAVAGGESTFAAYLPSTLGSSADISQISPEVALPTTQTTGPSSAPVTYAQQAGGLSVPFVSSVNGFSGSVTIANAGLLGSANTWSSQNTFDMSVTVPEGSNAYMGTAALNGSTPVTVSTGAVSAKSRIYLTHQVVSGTPGVPYVGTVTAGASFTVVSGSGSDASTVAWLIVNHT